MSTAETSLCPDSITSQPHAIIERDGVRYTLLGTAHISKASVAVVKKAVASGDFDTIAVELDAHRHLTLTEPDTLYKMDLFQILREGKTGLVAANLALAAYQRRLAEQLGVEPGAELKVAAIEAGERNLTLSLIDRDVGITLKRAWGKLGFWGRSKLMAGLATSLFVNEKVEESEIEKLKQGDMLESSFGEFAAQTPELFEAVIGERDRYMAAKLRELANNGSSREVLAIVGAGHLQGLAQHLSNDQGSTQETITALDTLPVKSNIPWFTIALIAFLLGGFAWGFFHGGLAVGGTLILYWSLITGLGGALGCLAAGGHPLSILAAFLASPLTPLHPALSSGMASAYVEAWRRKPTYADFMSLRNDTNNLRGWWHNRVTRIFLNYLLTNMGTVLGVWVAGFMLIHKLG